MTKKSLTKLNLQELSKILEGFGNHGRIFNSEAQFQFELAWVINEAFDCNVILEGLSREYRVQNNYKNAKTPTITKKDYTDIILEKDDYRIAIELKYKTATLEHKQLSLNNHGAVDLGSYDFMWDVNRLQMLTAKPKNETVKMPCNRGYAVILTNDYHYWTEPKNWDTSNQRINKGINRMFRIHGDKNGNGVLTRGTHEWYDINGNPGLSTAIQNDKSRQNGITLKRDYPYQWLSYYMVPNEKNGEFRFMIVEVD